MIASSDELNRFRRRITVSRFSTERHLVNAVHGTQSRAKLQARSDLLSSESALSTPCETANIGIDKFFCYVNACHRGESISGSYCHYQRVWL
jgi:hypothetical protein